MFVSPVVTQTQPSASDRADYENQISYRCLRQGLDSLHLRWPVGLLIASWHWYWQWIEMMVVMRVMRKQPNYYYCLPGCCKLHCCLKQTSAQLRAQLKRNPGKPQTSHSHPSRCLSASMAGPRDTPP